MRVLVIHTEYKFKGGEDGVMEQEIQLLKANGIIVEKLLFTNEGNSLLKFLQLPFNIGSYRKTKKIIAAFQPDVVHIHNLHFAASISILYAIKKFAVPCVYTLHNYRLLCPSGTLFYNGKNFSDSLKSPFSWKAVFKGVYKNSKLLTFWLSFSIWLNRVLNIWKLIDRFIVLTPHAKEIISESRLKLDSKKVVVKPNFTVENSAPVNGKGNHYLYIGRLSAEKGIETLLPAFKNSNFSLTIIGDGPLKNEVIAFAKENKNVTYLGFQKRAAINEELRKCTALLFPSVWYETFGLTIIEAFAASTPVIASKIGAPSKLIEDGYNGLHFEVANPDSLRSQMVKWSNFSVEEKQLYGIQAYASFKEHFTAEKNFVQLMNIYQSAIQHKQLTANSAVGNKAIAA